MYIMILSHERFSRLAASVTSTSTDHVELDLLTSSYAATLPSSSTDTIPTASLSQPRLKDVVLPATDSALDRCAVAFSRRGWTVLQELAREDARCQVV